jgi:hypothetical protein
MAVVEMRQWGAQTLSSMSYLLELSQKTTNASEHWPGPEPIQHFSIACCDDVIDVIACMEPVVRQLP